MKTSKLTRGLILFSMLAFTACKKEPGPGGKAHIHGHVEYEATEETIVNATVSIWYDATSKPLANADDATTANGEGEFEFENLNKGDYYLYAIGSDTSGTLREGGVAASIDKKSGEFDADIHVE